MDAIVYDKIDEVQGKVEYNGGGINSLQNRVAAIKSDTETLKTIGAVKSVQRGVLTGQKNLQNQKWINLTTISPVDTEKAMLNVCCTLVNGTRAYSQFAYQLNGDKIQIYFYNGSSGDYAMMIFSWEIIEFY